MKKLIALILTMSMALIFVSCGAKAPQDVPASAQSVDWQEQFDLGTCYLSEGKYEEAILAFTKVIEIEPKNAAAYVGRGDAYVLNNEQLEEAFADYEKALSIDEKTEKAYLGLADVYIRQNQIDKALEIAEKGYAVLGSSALLDKKEDIEESNISDSSIDVRRENCYDGDGNLIWYHEVSYENGRRSGVTAHTFYEYENEDLIETGEKVSYLPVNYDDRGNEIETYWIYGEIGSIGACLLEYDSNDILVKYTSYGSDGNVLHWYVYEYDANGNIEREMRYDYDGSLYRLHKCECNANGEKIKSTSYRPDGSFYGWDEYEYNANGRITKETNYKSDGSMFGLREDEYDENGKLTRRTYYDSDGRKRMWWEYEYDADGNAIKDTRYNADGTVEQYIDYQ